MFQSLSGEPSSAVVPDSRAGGFYLARKGRTSFSFSFKLPRTLPSSCAIGGNATRRYELHARATVRRSGNTEIPTATQVVQVVEDWSDFQEQKFSEKVAKSAVEMIKVGGAERIELHASVLGNRLVWRPEDGHAHIELVVKVRNTSKQKVRGPQAVADASSDVR